MSTSACNDTTVTVANAHVTYVGENAGKATITLVSAGPTGNNGGTLTLSDGSPFPADGVEIKYDDSLGLIASSASGSNGEFNAKLVIRCNDADSSSGDTGYQDLTVTIYGTPSKDINSKGCDVGGGNVSTEDFTASVVTVSGQPCGENSITVSVSNGGTNANG